MISDFTWFMLYLGSGLMLLGAVIIASPALFGILYLLCIPFIMLYDLISGIIAGGGDEHERR